VRVGHKLKQAAKPPAARRRAGLAEAA